MSDAARVEPDGETPVNPYSLLEAVNNSSDTAHTAWLIFLAIMAYLTIAVAGVTHKDLLLETPVTLPIMQVQIQLAQFFQFAPVILMLFHLGVVSQLVLLARKTLEFDYAVRALEVSDRRTHPLRLELHNFFFVQAVAGPHRSLVMGAFLHGMTWLTLVVLPVVLLLFIQISFLPYHDVTITWTHRICLVLDIAMLVLIGVFLMRAETSFFAAFWQTTVSNPVSFVVTTAVLAAVAMFSFFVATIPGEALDRGRGILTRTSGSFDGQHAAVGFALPFFSSRADGSLFGRFHRNLVVTDTDLVSDRTYAPGETSISLRGRDLRFARLDRSDLHRADLTSADLSGASLIGTDLREVRLNCADINELILSEDRNKAKCARARSTNFTRARLTAAWMTGIDITEARLEEAELQGVNLSYALAVGANFSGAQMEKADLTGGAHLEGANMLLTVLRGADLFGARLQGADMSSTNLIGAMLMHAHLEGVNLRDADLEGADLQNAFLLRAELAGAKIRAADLRGAVIWQASPPARESLALADLSGINLRPPSRDEIAYVQKSLQQLSSSRVKPLVEEAVAPLLNSQAGARWATSDDRQAWTSYAVVNQSVLAPTYGPDLTVHLTTLMCKARYADGSVAAGIARRAQINGFRGNIVDIYQRLSGGRATQSVAAASATGGGSGFGAGAGSSADNPSAATTAGASGSRASVAVSSAMACPAARSIGEQVLQRLSQAIDMAAGN